MSRSDAIIAELRAKRLARQVPPAPTAPPYDPTKLILGRDSSGAPVSISARSRLEHAHVIGTTGSGKSKFLEHCILQDIAMGHGVCVVDPHGNHPDSLYRSILKWVGTNNIRRPIHIVDPNAGSHATGFNPLDLPDEETALSVVSGTVREAVARAWGDEDSDQKPTMTRVLEGTFTTLAEQRLTLVEADLLYQAKDPHGIRSMIRGQATDRISRAFLERLDMLSGNQRMLDQEIIAALNRLSKFVRNPSIRAALGQTETQIDFRAALDEGHIILVNLSGGAAVYEEDADLVGRMFVRSLFFHAKRRARTDRPFFMYLDECHRYLSGDVPNLLAEARKYGLGVILGHQYLRQLGEPDELLRHAVLNNTNLKVVFRVQNPTEAAELAESVMDIDYEKPLKASIKPTVVGHKLTELHSTNLSHQSATSRATARTQGEVFGETQTTSESIGVSEGDSLSRSSSKSASATRGRSRSMTESEGESIGEGISMGEGMTSSTSHTITTGMSTGANTGAVTTPAEDPGWGFLPVEEPEVTAESYGDNSSQSSSSADGSSQAVSSSRTHNASRTQSMARSRAEGESDSIGDTVGRTEGATQSRSFSTTRSKSHGSMHAVTSAVSQSESTTDGLTKGSGSAQTFESVYADLPGQFHSKDNVLSMAGEAVRSQADGVASISFFAAGKRVRTMLRVPFVKSKTLSDAELVELRTALLDRSPSALPIAEAISLVEEREAFLIESAKAARLIEEPESFRTPRKGKNKDT